MSSDTGRRRPRVQVTASCADAAGEEARTVPAAFSASETFDVGVDLGSTVSLDHRR
jgi:hypothetical protein